MSRKVDPLLLGVLAVAFGLRLQGIADDGFWLDEVTSLHDADRSIAAILLGKGKPGHPPLYYLLLKGWVALFGTSETAVRLLSALCGTAAVGATCALFRMLHGRAAGLAASLLLALSFHHIVFSQEARNYALFGFLAVASAHAFWRALAEGGRRRSGRRAPRCSRPGHSSTRRTRRPCRGCPGSLPRSSCRRSSSRSHGEATPPPGPLPSFSTSGRSAWASARSS